MSRGNTIPPDTSTQARSGCSPLLASIFNLPLRRKESKIVAGSQAGLIPYLLSPYFVHAVKVSFFPLLRKKVMFSQLYSEKKILLNSNSGRAKGSGQN